MKNVYLAFAIVGAVVPYLFFTGFFMESGLDLPLFIGALFANGAAAGFTADLLITSVVFWIYMFSREGGPVPWPFMILNLTIGLSCALPAYLYVLAREAEAATAAA
ncbi:MAG: DUF2834 domain-containing protein [Pseudomonadota bacterium]